MLSLSCKAFTALLLTAITNPAWAQTASRWAIYDLNGFHRSSTHESNDFLGSQLHNFSGDERFTFGDAASSGNGSSAASGYVESGFGWMRLSGVVTSVSGANASDHDNSGQAELAILAQFTDVLTISNPARNGSAGSVFLSTLLDGGLSPAVNVSGPSDYAGGYTEGHLGATFLGMVFYEANSIDLLPVVIDDAEVGGRTNFIFGQPFSITVNASVWMQAYSASYDASAAAVSFVADFSRTLTWGGMSELRDADGNAVLDYSVTSLSGTDYRNAIVPSPVPEPAAVLLWLLGLPLLAACRRRFDRPRTSAVSRP